VKKSFIYNHFIAPVMASKVVCRHSPLHILCYGTKRHFYSDCYNWWWVTHSNYQSGHYTKLFII